MIRPSWLRMTSLPRGFWPNQETAEPSARSTPSPPGVINLAFCVGLDREPDRARIGHDRRLGRQLRQALSETSVTTKACVTCTWALGEHLRWPDEDRELLLHVESASPIRVILNYRKFNLP